MTERPPPKYIKNAKGVMGKNPAYSAYEKRNGLNAHHASASSSGTIPYNDSEHLAVVSNMDDYESFNDASKKEHAMSEATAATFEMIQDPDISKRIGLSSDNVIDSLGKIFAKYEVPLGMMNKLMELHNYDLLEFIIDDSGSMGCISDTKDLYGKPMTRWQEAISRLKSLMEIAAYVPTPPIQISFLNRQDSIILNHNGEPPVQWLEIAYKEIDRVTYREPDGRTPAREVLERSFRQGVGKSVARYFFCDGEPNGGRRDVELIREMVVNRREPAHNPLTFLTCTGDDDQAEWMKEVEEVAAYCSELDDFCDERAEVVKDQGLALPFTKGFYLVGQLVAAMNPDDLDAMDESVPMTKSTLDNLLGIEHSEQDYQHYFSHFCLAQSKRIVEEDNQADVIKKNTNWAPYYREFLTTDLAKNIRFVQDFKRRLVAAIETSPPMFNQQQSYPPQQQYGQPQIYPPPQQFGQQTYSRPAYPVPQQQSYPPQQGYGQQYYPPPQQSYPPAQQSATYPSPQHGPNDLPAYSTLRGSKR